MTRALWVVEATNAHGSAQRRWGREWMPTKPTAYSRAQARHYAKLWRDNYGGRTRVVKYTPEAA